MAGIPITLNFDLKAPLPLDSRLLVANTNQLNSINPKYSGMIVYAANTQKLYYLENLNTNTWSQLGTGSFGGGGVSLNNVVYTSGDQTISGSKTFIATGFYYSGGFYRYDKQTRTVFEENVFINKINNQTSFGIYNHYFLNKITPISGQLSTLPLGIRTGNIVNLFFNNSGINNSIENNLIVEPTIMVKYTGNTFPNDIIPIVGHPFYTKRALKKINYGGGNKTFIATGVYYSGGFHRYDKQTKTVFEDNVFINKINNQTSFGTYNHYFLNKNFPITDQLSNLPVGIRTGNIVNLFFNNSGINNSIENNLLVQPMVMVKYTGNSYSNDIIPITGHPFYTERALKKINYNGVTENVVYTTGNQTISGVKSFTDDTVFKDKLFYISQPSGQISGAGYTGYYDGGQFLGRTKLSQSNTRLVNVGNTWTAKDSNRNWTDISLSSDGKYQSAVVNGEKIYVSNDYGNTWEPKEANRRWTSISISSDGKYQTATVYQVGQIHISSDYGNTWAAKESSRNWISVALSSDGKYQSAVVENGDTYVSSDYGNTWTAKGSSGNWYYITISSDGKYQSAVGYNKQIYVSNDYGDTWNPKGIYKSFLSVSMSSDGRYQVAVGPDASSFVGCLGISNDYGNTWSFKDISIANLYWKSISISSDGKYQSAVANNGQIHISSDYGNTWAAKESSRNWISVALSSDGKYQTALHQGGKIYVSVADEIIDGSFTADNIYGNNLVYNTGNQTISGVKTFATRPKVGTSGVLLEGEIPSLPNTIVYATGNQLISGQKQYANETIFLDNVSFQKHSTLYDKLTLTNQNWSEKYSVSGTGNNTQIAKNIYLNKDGNVLIASSNPDNPFHTSPVYIYTTGSNQEWSLKQTITGNNRAGTSFTMSKDNSILCVGNSEYFGNVARCGGVHIYTGSPNIGWNFKQTLQGSVVYQTFGASITMDENGGVIAVGSPNVGTIDFYTGSKNTSWIFKYSITGDVNGSRFGGVMQFNENANILAVGAYRYSLEPDPSGYAYTYTGNSTNGWNLQQKFSVPTINLRPFGTSLAINNSGTILMVGHPDENDNKGAIYFYTGSNTSFWNLVDKVYGLNYYDQLGHIRSNHDASIIVARKTSIGLASPYALIFKKSSTDYKWFIKQLITPLTKYPDNTVMWNEINDKGNVIAFGYPYFGYSTSIPQRGNGLIKFYTDINPSSFTLGNVYPEDFARLDGVLKIVGDLNMTGNLNLNGSLNITGDRPILNGSGIALFDESVQKDSDARIVSLRFTQTGDNAVYSDPAPRIRTRFVSGGYDTIQITHGIFSNREILQIWESGVKLTHRPTVNGTGVLLSGEAAQLPETILYTTGDQTISGVKTFINTARVDSVNFTRNFKATGAPYNYTASSTFDYGVTGILYTGWNLATINPSDDNLSIKLSSGSLITIIIDGSTVQGSAAIEWRAVQNKFDLSQQIPFDLFSGDTAFQSITNLQGPGNGFGTVQILSGYLPKEYDRLVIRYLGGGGNIVYVAVSGNFGIHNEIKLETRNNRLFLGNSGVLFGGEAVAPLVDINNITDNFIFNSLFNSKLLTINASQNITGTVPAGLSTGYNVSFAQMGGGKLFITGSGGAIVRQRLNLFTTAGQYGIASLLHHSGDQFLLYGDLN